MKLPRNVKIFRGQLDAAPFAGVTFLLLIFLMLHTKLVFTPGVRIDLPQVPYRVPGTTNLSTVVAVDMSGTFYYQGKAIPETKLYDELKALRERTKEPLTLEVHGDRTGKLETAFRLWSMAGEIGFENVQIVSRPPLSPVRAEGITP
ncbi:MAG: biopolymer transporter ExbD [Verrucomicrobia bacterium]|nr:biopolymer transporter ExbD [Verrucomicrobiota bacterium]